MQTLWRPIVDVFEPSPEDEVYQSTHWRVILNLNQNKLGNLLVILKRYSDDVTALEDHELMDLWDVVRRSKQTLHLCFSPLHINYCFLMNRRRHVHLHIIPRYYEEQRHFEGVVFHDDDHIDHRRMPPNIHQRLVQVVRDGFTKLEEE